MLWTIIGLLVILWILGLVFKITSGLIHILIVIALVLFIFRLITGSRV